MMSVVEFVPALSLLSFQMKWYPLFQPLYLEGSVSDVAWQLVPKTSAIEDIVSAVEIFILTRFTKTSRAELQNIEGSVHELINAPYVNYTSFSL